MVKSAVAAVALATMAVAVPAVAATYDIDAQSPISVFHDASGHNAWYVNVTRTLTDGSSTISGQVGAGLFRVVEDLPGRADRAFDAFCLTPGVWLNLNVDYAAGTGLSDSVVGALGALRRNAFDMVVDAVSAGAFQIAVWEIVSEQGSYNLASGNIRFSGANSAVALAASWLANVQSGAWAPTRAGMRFHDAQGSSQDLLEIAPVPLPASGILLFGGVAAVIGLSRRKRKV